MNGPFRVERAHDASWRDDKRWLTKHCKSGWTRMLEGRFDGKPDTTQQLYRDAQSGIIKGIIALYGLPYSQERDDALARLNSEASAVAARVTSHDLIEFDDGKMAMLFKLARAGAS